MSPRLLLDLLNAASLTQLLVSVLCVKAVVLPAPGSFSKLLGDAAIAGGLFYREQDEFVQAQHSFELAIHAFTLVQDPVRLGRALNAMSCLCLQQQNPARSLTYSQASVAILETTEAQQDYALAMHQLGVSYLRRKQLTEAEPCLELALSLYHELQDSPWENRTLIQLGHLYAQKQASLFALACYEAALDSLLVLYDKHEVCQTMLLEVLCEIGIFCQEIGQESWTAATYQDVLSHFTVSRRHAQLVQIFQQLGQIHEANQRYKLALECYDHALQTMPVTSPLRS